MMLLDSISRLYRAGKLTAAALDAAVNKGWISQEEKARILEVE